MKVYNSSGRTLFSLLNKKFYRLLCRSNSPYYFRRARLNACCVRFILLTMFLFFFLDTFQVLIQYPDVVSAQSAKLVSIADECRKGVFD